ncbi:MAG: SDR family NAD(P)-dependent oxidoreductase, partial [Verrucomicrobia bacterium]|nr:SDR family NAD(P)-dependent oxidoreductase [Verrucomicrobiota bacterium]
GGVNLYLHPSTFVGLCQMRMLAADGKTRSFGEGGNGFVPGEGVGAVLLKPLSAALADGDHVYGVIRGSALNHGGHTNGYSVPNPNAQAALIRTALARAGVQPRDVGYVEAHGTGTALGDPVEIAGLTIAFRSGTADCEFCAIGSVKSNIGHLEAAAGIAAVTKTLLQMQHGQLVPSLHSDPPNPRIDFASTPFRVQRGLAEWQRDGAKPCLAGVSSFGAGGANAHLVLASWEPTVSVPEPNSTRPELIVLSARTPERLAEVVKRLADCLRAVRAEHGPRWLRDIAHTLRVGREAMEERLAFVVSSQDELILGLDEIRSGGSAESAGIFRGRKAGPKESFDPRGKELPEIAAAWAGGADIDWSVFDAGSQAKRVSLPTYPFVRERHWIATFPGKAAESLHPLLDRNASTLEEQRFLKLLRPDELLVREHVVRGAKLLPAAACLEMARAAGDASREDATVTAIACVVWTRPIRVDEAPLALGVSLSPERDRVRFEIWSEAGDSRVPHVQGQLRFGASPTRPDPLNLAEALARMPVVHEPVSIYEAYRSLGLQYGPAFRALEWVRSNDREVLASIRLPEAGAGLAGACKLNPLVLDAAFQSVIGFGWGRVGSAPSGPVLPFEADEITFFGSLPEVCQVLVTEVSSEPAAVRAYNLTLVAGDGSVLASVNGFKVKPAIGTGAGQDRPVVKPPAAASMPAEPLLALLQERLKQIIAAQLKVDADDVEANENFAAYGFDSVSLTNFSNQLNLQFGIETTPALFFERPTVVRLAQFLMERFGDPMRRALGESVAQPVQAEPEPRQIPKPARFAPGAGSVADSRAKPGDPIAVIGMDGRFPGAPTLDKFWENLELGVHSVTEVPADRWDWRQHNPAARWGGFVADVDKFDAAFFGISPREAELMDPQQRLFLEVVWNTLENAGYAGDPLKPRRIGLFVGVATRDYAELVAGLQRMEAHTATGLSHSILANRVSYLLNLTGPSEAIDTACSSSLVALHRAVASLRAGECSLAVAGGVNAVLTPATTLGFVEAGMLCADGRCRTFDAEASGYVRGEGVGAVLLKRLEEAVRDGDVIYGVIRGTAVNHGGRVNSLTAPNPNAQAEVIREALAEAQITPDTIGYIETHGTGTPLGDPVEVNGLKMVFKERGAGVPVPRCGLGSVKTNVGHLESAAGIAGVIKVLLALRHGRIPASLHFGRLNPYIQLEGSPFYIAKETHAWPRPGADVPRCAGVSSFGFGGANAHVVIEEFLAPTAAPEAAGNHLVTLSAKTDQALAKRISDLADWLATNREAASLGHLAFTLSRGRWHMPKRCAVLARSLDELSEALAALASNQRPANCLVGTGGRLDSEDEAACRRVWEELVMDFTSGAPPDRTSEAWRAKLWSVAEIYVKGFKVDWRIVYGGTVNKIALPGYPFLRQRHWIPEPLSAAQPVEGAGLAARFEHTAESVACFTEEWPARPISSLPSSRPGPRVLLIGADEPLRGALRRESPTEQLIALDWGSGAGEIPNDSSFSDVVLCLPRQPSSQAAAEVGKLLGWARALLVLRGSDRVKLMVWESADEPSPVLAAAAALLKSLRLECPEFNVSAVCGKGGTVDETARWIGLELAAGESSGVEVHYRQGVRRVRCVVPRTLPRGAERAGIREGGVYLVTGGGGRLGMAVAAWLAGVARVRVALTGRSPSGEHTQDCVRKLREMGCEARYFQSDVVSRESVAALVAQIEDSWGRLNGVVHAAGVLRDGLLAARTADQEQSVLAPKILGAMNLDLATRGSDLDWFVCFSSLTAALGNIGQTAYAAANGFLDGFARWREGLRSAGERRGATISIDWPFWRDGSMRLGDNAAEQAAREDWLRTNLGLEALCTEDGLKVLESVLAAGPSLVIVGPGDAVRIRGVLERAFGLVTDSTPSAGRCPAVSADTAEKLLRELKSEVADLLKLGEAEIDPEANLTGLGFDSILLKAFAVRLSQKYGVELTPNAFFTHTHLNAVRDLLLELAPGRFGAEPAASEPPKPTAAVTARSAALERAPLPGRSTGPEDPVVVVGMSGRFPGAPDLDAFWRNLAGGVDSIGEVPSDRFDLRDSGDGGTASEATRGVRWGGFIADVDKFDAAFFGISPREAELMDPQHRLLLEEAWRAVESSGESPARLAGRAVGVFVGIQYHDYQDLLAEAGAAHTYSSTGNGHAMAANRISHCLDLRGPSEAVDTACSSSLIALHRAVSLLQRGDCESALVAGVSLMLSPRAFVGTSQIGVLSPDGRCKTFDAAANGYVRGEGVGVLYLMRFTEAERRRLPILAVIRGVGVNHGGRGQSLTAPNARSQAELLAQVYRTAGVDATTIGYIEAHGTGTELGDPVEFDGLKEAFARTRRPGASEARGYCGLGSVKTNIGHLEAAAGVAGVIKVILALRKKLLPASLHLNRVNPFI